MGEALPGDHTLLRNPVQVKGLEKWKEEQPVATTVTRNVCAC